MDRAAPPPRSRVIAVERCGSSGNPAFSCSHGRSSRSSLRSNPGRDVEGNATMTGNICGAWPRRSCRSRSGHVACTNAGAPRATKRWSPITSSPIDGRRQVAIGSPCRSIRCDSRGRILLARVASVAWSAFNPACVRAPVGDGFRATGADDRAIASNRPERTVPPAREYGAAVRDPFGRSLAYVRDHAFGRATGTQRVVRAAMPHDVRHHVAPADRVDVHRSTARIDSAVTFSWSSSFSLSSAISTA